jgi:peroxiredoxin
MKNKTVLYITGCVILLLTSCLGSDDNTSATPSRDAQIETFSLTNDSVPGLGSVKFTIDQLNGLIFNMDSMPYETKVERVLCNITFVSYAINAAITPGAQPDTTFSWTDKDSVDFSKPVKIVVTAVDGATTKTYTAQVNIHQVNPDSMLWNLHAGNPVPETIMEQNVVARTYNDTEVCFMYIQTSGGYKLYYSPVTDAAHWEELPLSGLDGNDKRISQLTIFGSASYIPSDSGILYSSSDGIHWTPAGSNSPVVRSLLGALGEGRNQAPVLAAVIEDDGRLSFACMNENKEWTIGENVHDKFPVINFASYSYINMYHAYVMLAGGRDAENQLTNTTWATMNGKDWILLTNEGSGYFEKREGMSLTRYDEKLFLTGGMNAEGKATKEIYTSTDYGVTWARQDSLVVFPDAYKARGFASVQVDKDNYMLIFGGKTSNDTYRLNEIWRGRINRLSF